MRGAEAFSRHTCRTDRLRHGGPVHVGSRDAVVLQTRSERGQIEAAVLGPESVLQCDCQPIAARVHVTGSALTEFASTGD